MEEDEAWLEYKKKFAEQYDDFNYSSTVQSFVMRKSHSLLEKAYDERFQFDQVLEVGAGTGEHLVHVRHNFRNYTISDLDSSSLEIAKSKNNLSNISYEVQNAGKLSYSDNTFDRVVATHVLEHMNQPHLALKEWVRVLKNGGTLSVLIPTDPGFAWRMARHFGPRRRAIAQGIAYDYIMAREHVNSCVNLIAIMRHYFPLAKEAWWPFPIPSVDLNLFFAFHAEVQKESL